MDIWDLLGLAALVYVAFRAGQITVSWQIFQTLKHHAESTGQTLEQAAGLDQADGSEESFKVERVEGQYFAYGDTMGFLAQGTTFREMFDRIKSRYPGHSFRIRDYQTSLTEEESGRMIRAIFDVFGDHDEKSKRG